MPAETLAEISRPATPKPLRLLILENSPRDVEIILQELQIPEFLIKHRVVENRAGFCQALEEGEFDAVLADYRLSDWTGLEALKVVRGSGKDVPFLLVTGTLGEEAAVECIKQGVSDYILKDRISRLRGALRRAIREKELRDENARAQAALAASEARAREQYTELDLIYRTAPVGLAVFDRDLRYLRVNEVLARSHALPASEHLGKSLQAIIPHLAEKVGGYLRRVLDSGESILNVEMHPEDRKAATGMRDSLASFYPLRGEDGSVFAACVVLVDISERKRADEALRLSEARNHDLVEHSIYGIFRIGADGCFQDANPALLRILGCSTQEELRTLNLMRDIFRYPEQYAEFVGACRQKGHVHGQETEWHRRDGGLVAVRLQLRQLASPGQEETIEFMAEDVTEVRAMERQLRQTQKFEAIGQLAGGIAHDFNNVVGAILGWAELGAEQNRSSPEVAERFTRIREQAERAATLTRELLAFSRRQVLQPRPVDLNSVTSNLISFLDRVISKDIELKVMTAPLDSIKGDPTQLEQVLMNLCLNARDAMPSGGRLFIETEMVELDDSYCRFYPYVSAGRYAVLSVSDTGMGMDLETRERIFEPFFTTKEQGKGTGMGLSTVYGIVKQHGGFIHVYSEPGQGSLFRVYLPAMAESAQAGAPPPVAAPTGAPLRGTETILLAEDHESIREMARQTLTSLGYRVLSASDGQEALRLCEQEVPAIAVLDVVMPRLGGPAVASQLLSRFGAMPVLFTSGYSHDPDGLISPGAHYLQKPYSPTTLGRVIREILDKPKEPV